MASDLLDRRRYPVPPSFEPSAAANDQGVHGQSNASEDPFVQDDHRGFFELLPYTSYRTFPDLSALNADYEQSLEYIEGSLEVQVQYSPYSNKSVSSPHAEQFQQHNLNDQALHEQPEPQFNAGSSATLTNPSCPKCQRAFARACDLNVHMKSHTLPFKCPKPSCDFRGSRYLKGQERHIKEKHPELRPNAERYFCPMDSLLELQLKS
ncbi:hypothetical protein EYC80_011043 [Monilinia laxa]|uniref:C2H2-type domain-containing protein n=1 Tax=Monilinia laxa TaxID=61186 RepID=A0A5N6JRN3_MONLA|nr:hypothetical protein EYC80_011043 [Monilinia laxa]